jgi:neutral ceramidase
LQSLLADTEVSVMPLLICLLLLTLLPATAIEHPPLRAGVARVDITPTNFGPMYGYANRRCGDAAAIHDRLYAKVLYLEAGTDRMAIVTMDLGSMEAPNLFQRVTDELHIPLLLLAPSHTHSAPRFLPSLRSSDSPTPYLNELEQKLFTAIREASRDLFEAKLSVAKGSIQLGYNRLLMRENGRARALFDNLQRVPYGPVDPEFVLLQVSDLIDEPRALLMQYAAHPVVLGSTSCVYSADYPGVLQARVESAMPGVQAMFVQGAAGCTNPLFQGRTGDQDKDLETMTTMGELLADEVLRTTPKLAPLPTEPASIAYRTRSVRFPDRWDPTEHVSVGISTVFINNQIAIATVPGEPFLEMQTRWKQEADAPVPLFFGYTQTTPDRWPGYIPDIRSAAYGGYGADVQTTISVGAAEQIINQHRIQLYDIKGMWHKEPGRP